jgi:hypothetical protein
MIYSLLPTEFVRTYLESSRPCEAHADQHYEHGMFLLNGIGTPKDIDTGIRFLESAAELGSKKAQQNMYKLGRVYNRPLKAPDERIRSWLLSAVETGSSTAALQDFRNLFSETSEARAAETCVQNRMQSSKKDTIIYRSDVLRYIDLPNPEKVNAYLTSPESKAVSVHGSLEDSGLPRVAGPGGVAPHNKGTTSGIQLGITANITEKTGPHKAGLIDELLFVKQKSGYSNQLVLSND